MKAIVDRELCIGCGLCVQVCPEVFEMDDGGRAAVKMEMVLPDIQESCSEAAMECPVIAISIV